MYVGMMILIVLIIAGMMAVGVLASLYGLMKIDKDHGMEFSLKEIRLLCLGSLICACIWYGTSGNLSPVEQFAWLVIHMYFLGCSVMDHLTCQVYDIFQYPGIGAAAYLALSQNDSDMDNIMIGGSILVFALLQYLLFMRMYGKADGMAFLTASLAEASLGYEIDRYFLHMILAYLLLGVVQGIRGNIGRRGRLAKPVPFLPYIMVCFWGII